MHLFDILKNWEVWRLMREIIKFVPQEKMLCSLGTHYAWYLSYVAGVKTELQGKLKQNLSYSEYIFHNLTVSQVPGINHNERQRLYHPHTNLSMQQVIITQEWKTKLKLGILGTAGDTSKQNSEL